MVQDQFAILEQPRRPWLDLEELNSQFVRLAASSHPDRFHQAGDVERQQATERYAALNSAHQCLRDSGSRLGHLLELESGAKPTGLGPAPPEVLDLFSSVGQCCQNADRFLADQSRARSPLLRVQRFEKALELTEEAFRLLELLRSRRAPLEARLRPLNAAWDTAPPVNHPDRIRHLPMSELENIYRTWSYLSRWTAQLQERVTRLASALD